MVIQTLLEVFVDVVPTGSAKCNRNYSPSLLMTVLAICPGIPDLLLHDPDIALGPGRVEMCACVPMLEDARTSYSTAYACFQALPSDQLCCRFNFWCCRSFSWKLLCLHCLSSDCKQWFWNRHILAQERWAIVKAKEHCGSFYVAIDGGHIAMGNMRLCHCSCGLSRLHAHGLNILYSNYVWHIILPRAIQMVVNVASCTIQQIRNQIWNQQEIPCNLVPIALLRSRHAVCYESEDILAIYGVVHYILGCRWVWLHVGHVGGKHSTPKTQCMQSHQQQMWESNPECIVREHISCWALPQG